MRWATIVFDCDGVVLDSNRVKTEAFRAAALPYGADAAEALVAYHVANGGISRYAKFKYFLDNIVTAGWQGSCLDELLTRYAILVREGLLNCTVARGLETLRMAMPGVRWLIASGGDQQELREIFALRGLDRYFDGGIFGSPDTKDVILAREMARDNIVAPALFLGDSRYDHQAACRAGLDFIFVYGWSEFPDWEQYTIKQRIQVTKEILTFTEQLNMQVPTILE